MRPQRQNRITDNPDFEEACSILCQNGDAELQADLLLSDKDILVESVDLAESVVINRDTFSDAFHFVWREEMRKHASYFLWASADYLSARARLTTRQALWFGTMLLASLLAINLRASAAIACFSVIALAAVATILWPKLSAALTRHPPAARNGKPKIKSPALPVFTVLVPLFREISIVPNLIESLLAIDYPPENLDIKFLVEEIDDALRNELSALMLPAHFKVLIVPRGVPQTKPRALNYGLISARGELLVVFDAEDIPERQQLRIAASHFHDAASDVGCFQSRLVIYNSRANWLTRQFALEYGIWFGSYLPALCRHRWPVPLGGTSNHFRTSILRKIGGWDPFNVAEDADLGLRLKRLGFRVEMLPSRTLEEAPKEFASWLRQRSRWVKGYLQTAFVHSRRPFKTVQRIGLWRWWCMQVLMFGSVISLLLHPFLVLAASTSFAINGSFNLTSLVGALLMLANYALVALLGARNMKREYGVIDYGAILTLPLYWLLLSIPAMLAIIEFVWRPHHWHKTPHGTSGLNKAQAIASSHPGLE